MKKEITFLLYAIKKNIHSSAELRTSFLMNLFGMFINNISFVVIWIFLITTVGDIGGWSSADIFGLQGFVALVYGLLFSFGAGLRNMSACVSSGVFDQFLLSPKNLLSRIAVSSFSVSALGDIIFGVTCICIYGFMIHMSFLQGVIMLICLLAALLTFFGFVVVVQSVGFYFTDSTSVTDSLFELFFAPSLMHGGAFQGKTRFFFTFIFPSLLIGTLPVEAITSISYIKAITILFLSFFWCIFSLWLFKKAVKKYESSNFINFG